MNLKEIKTRIRAIKQLAEYDPEGAHSREDSLYKDMLVAIVEGKCDDDPIIMIREVLKTKKLKFPRWSG